MTYPDKKLRKLLYRQTTLGPRAEGKMDELYAEILSSVPLE